MFPWLKAEFGFNYAELGLLMTIFGTESTGYRDWSGYIAA
jgi:hypothetical protein